MKIIKVLGTGCAKCKTTLKRVEDTAAAEGLSLKLEKVEDSAQIARYGIMSTPAVVIDGMVVHAGGLPSQTEIRSWLSDV